MAIKDRLERLERAHRRSGGGQQWPECELLGDVIRKVYADEPAPEAAAALAEIDNQTGGTVSRNLVRVYGEA